MLVENIKQNLSETLHLLESIDNELYTTCHAELSNATIGEHNRHIIELFEELLKGYEIGIVNYDKRIRNLELQSDKYAAIKAIQTIMNAIEKPNKTMVLQQGTDEISLQIESNYERELLYNLEHSIHHQALIKVALHKYPQLKISDAFGVAQSTLVYRNQCVQ